MLALRRALALLVAVIAFTAATAQVQPQQQGANSPVIGPVNAVFPPAGEAIRKDLATALPAGVPWAIKGWVRIDSQSAEPRPVAVLVDQSGATLVELGILDGQLFASAAQQRVLAAPHGQPGEWLLVTLASTGDGIVLKVGDGEPVTATIQLAGAPVAVVFAPRSEGSHPYAGAVANFTMWQGTAAAAGNTAWAKPDEALIQFETGSPTWPYQVKQYMGLTAPQDPASLPTSRSAAKPALARTLAGPGPELAAQAEGRWTLGAWRFSAAPQVSAAPAALSQPGFDDRGWMPAIVPGTVLTSYVANGVYPDPAFGLNNLLIPERLSRQDYWYRAEFVLPDDGSRSRAALDFGGINYAAEIWVNGERLGATRGAFIRGRFELPAGIRPGDRVAVAVRVSPPPHPGLTHEESLAAGPGQNGGAMSIDGPSFTASQGWDWIPTVRDRDTGIWQDVVLETSGAVRLGDPQIRTVLPRPDNSIAELTIEVPVENQSAGTVTATVSASFDDVALSQSVQVAPHGSAVVRFAPSQYAQLRIQHPALWWPNGYGAPTLHKLSLAVAADGAPSDQRELRFGMREVSYELSLVDSAEELQRVDVSPARGSGEQLIDVRHRAIRKIDGGWAASLAEPISASPALAAAPPSPLAPYLLIRVNGTPIAVRGGNWGMDDWLKRASRERLEPYFRLHRDANVNTIRNWLGQNTEPVFYDLADEYGLLVLNDFWLSSQDHNAEPGDSALFLANAADTISRYRSHPSIILWIGRNEGVPPPVLNNGLERLVRELDGTRAYLPNSRQVNMTNSGPWNYQPPAAYFTKLAPGFSTEVGTPSFPTLETFKAMMPAEDQWPISDSWAYHDWHQGKAGDVSGFMKALAARFGEPTDLADFEKKAQLMDFESHRAIFEGMNDGLFVRNSGRLLWMTHPAWPSTMWQMYSYDYDTQSSYFGVKRGSEPVHVQLSPVDRSVSVIDSLGQPLASARLRIRNYDLAGHLLSDRKITLSAAPYAATKSEIAFPDSLFDKAPVVITKLELFDQANRLLSDNLYWLARDNADYRTMTAMAPARLALSARAGQAGDENELRVTVKNESAVPALMVKLGVLDATGARVLPAYWSDNYLSLLPGETRTLTIRTPRAGAVPKILTVSGWNVTAARQSLPD